MRQKSIFSSLTFWAIVLGYMQTLIPTIKLGHHQGYDFDFFICLLEATIVFAIAVIGRHNANTIVYTPKTLPGRNRK